jgi:hypothetical protein
MGISRILSAVGSWEKEREDDSSHALPSSFIKHLTVAQCYTLAKA